MPNGKPVPHGCANSIGGQEGFGDDPVDANVFTIDFGVVDELEQGRKLYTLLSWVDAHRAFSLADQLEPLAPEDLELFGISAYLVGRDDEFLRTFERAHHAWLVTAESTRAARCAFWLGLHLLLRREAGRAAGWLARAQRLLERHAHECVEHGYLRLPVAEQLLSAGDCEAAHAAADNAAAFGERFGDSDLTACARHVQGRALMQSGNVQAGLTLLDEAMVAVTAEELSPLMTGLIYCSVIDACQQVYAMDRAREWTSAMARWCDRQPQLVAFTGTCLVHRAEVMQWHGAWQKAFDHAHSACERYSRGTDQQPPAAAFYQQAEVHRLRGEFTAAEDAYRRASQWGCEPQPGFSLLRIAQGRTDAAVASMQRLMGATTDRLQRTRLLPAYVEILLAGRLVEEARTAARELESSAENYHSGVLTAIAAHARGAVELAGGDARSAILSLRRAFVTLQGIDSPYLAARTRELIGSCCRDLGDEDGRNLELDGARAEFERLGAAPDVARIDALTRRADSSHPHGLTPRELQVLGLVAAGNTNKLIAQALGLSEKTVDRHMSNILTKLDVPSRTAATAFAYEHQLIREGRGTS